MLGHNVYRIRKMRGYTLTELAERTGVSKSYLSNIERNLKQNPSIHVMEKIAEALKVDLKTLLRIAVEEEKKNLLEKEWLDFIQEFKKSGIEKEEIHEYKILIDFMKWQHEKQRKKQ